MFLFRVLAGILAGAITYLLGVYVVGLITGGGNINLVYQSTSRSGLASLTPVFWFHSSIFLVLAGVGVIAALKI